MDRAIVEVLNSVALICLSALIISVSYNIYFYYLYTNQIIEFNLIYNKIKNIIQRIYINVLQYGKSDNITLILNKNVYVKGNGSYYLVIYLYEINKTIYSPIKVVADTSSNILLFQYSNGILYITNPSPLYIPPIIMR